MVGRGDGEGMLLPNEKFHEMLEELFKKYM